MLGRVAMQGMHRIRLIVGLLGFKFWLGLRRDRAARALHPGRRAGRRAVILFRRRLVLGLRIGPRLQRMRGLGGGAEWIGLADQPCQFGQWIALSPVRAVTIIAVVVLGGKRSVLISISHRDDASPSGQRQTVMTQRIGPCHIPPQIPIVRAFAPAYRISVGAWTPRTAKPDARTETTPWTIASRAFVISASLLIMKRK